MIPTTTIDCSGELLFAYRYGNQITSTTLQVSRDGAVLHQERLQADVQDRPAATLQAAALESLLADLESASDGPFREVAGPASNLGSPSGTFEACDSTRNAFVVRNIVRADGMGDDRVVLNDANGVDALLTRARAYAENDMYDP